MGLDSRNAGVTGRSPVQGPKRALQPGDRLEISKVSTSNTVLNASHLLVIHIQESPTGIILIQAVWG